MAPPLTSPVVSTVTTTTHFFRLIAMARQSFRSDLPSHLTQMGDAKTQMDDAKAPVAWVN